MKRRFLLLAGIVAGLLIVFLFSLYLARRKENPEVLLAWLRKGKGDHEEIVMRLNMARGDVSTLMIRAFHDKSADDKFRTEVLDLLFKKNLRASEAKIESTFVEALRDPSPVIRKSVVMGLATYSEARLLPLIISFVNDPDPKVRTRVYTVFIQSNEVWEKMTEEQRKDIRARALKQRPLETDSLLIYYNHAFLGREIAQLCDQGVNAYQRTDLGKGDSLFQAAMTLDPSNKRPWLVRASYLIRNGNAAEAVKVAREGGTFIEIPRLPQAPKLDGDPTDPAWAKAWQSDTSYSGKGIDGYAWAYMPYVGKVKFFLGHLNGKIYIAIISRENDVRKLKITPASRDANTIWSDDCDEITLNPKKERKRFYKFTINPGGAIYDRYGASSVPNFKFDYGVKIFPDRGYWALEFAIDGKDLDNNVIRSGDIWSLCLNNCKIGNTQTRNGMEQYCDDEIFPLARFK